MALKFIKQRDWRQGPLAIEVKFPDGYNCIENVNSDGFMQIVIERPPEKRPDGRFEWIY